MKNTQAPMQGGSAMSVFGKVCMGYALIESNRIAEWKKFGAEGLGLHADQINADELVFRMDNHARRLIISSGSAEDFVAVGWQTESDDVTKEIVRRLHKQGVETRQGTPEEARLRGVESFVQFVGPKRMLIELFTRPVLTDKPMTALASGWITGDIGMGHLAITSAKPEAMLNFWKTCFDARLTDIIEATIGGIQLEIEFLRVNERHHSIAVAATKGRRLDPIRTRIQHMNLEVASMDDMTHAYIRCRKLGFRVAMGVGLHTNDKDLSFYVITPSGFQIECGWNPVLVQNESTWTPQVHQGISLWGHQPKDQTTGDKLNELRYGLRSLFKDEYAISTVKE